MKTFEYRGLDADGRVRKGLVEALGVKDAREKLSKTGILADRVSPAGDQHSRWRFGGEKGLSLDRRSVVYRELGALLKAGLPLVRAMDILIESPEMGEARGLLAKSRDDIREGVSLAEALSRASASVSMLEKALVAVGERSGTLAEALDRLASFLDEQQNVRDRIRTALMYPAVVVLVAVAVATGVFVFVLPQTAKVLREMRVEMPFITRAMMAVGKYTGMVVVPALAAIAVLGMSYGRRRFSDPAVRLHLDRLIFKIPLFGKGNVILANLRFARTLAILLHGGVPLVEAVRLGGRATGNTWIEHLAVAASESVRQGGSLSDAVRTIPPLADTLPGWIQAGEAGGGLEHLLLNAGDRYQRQWVRFITRTLGLLEPAIILLLGLFVLLVALSVLMPILSANQMVQ